jgi:hypothetical protein
MCSMWLRAAFGLIARTKATYLLNRPRAEQPQEVDFAGVGPAGPSGFGDPARQSFADQAHRPSGAALAPHLVSRRVLVGPELS